jgi:hypothetical protein
MEVNFPDSVADLTSEVKGFIGNGMDPVARSVALFKAVRAKGLFADVSDMDLQESLEQGFKEVESAGKKSFRAIDQLQTVLALVVQKSTDTQTTKSIMEAVAQSVSSPRAIQSLLLDRAHNVHKLNNGSVQNGSFKNETERKQYIEKIDLNKRSDTSLRRILPERIAEFKSTQWKTLSAPKFARLSPRQIGAISVEGMQGITEAQINKLKVAHIKELDPQQIAAMKPEAFAGLKKEHCKALTRRQIETITGDQLANIPPKSLGAMSPEQIASITPDAIAKLTEAQIKKISAKCIAAITPYQIVKLNPEHFNAMNRKQIAAISPKAFREIDPNILKQWDAPQFKYLTKKQMANVKLEQLNALYDDQIRNIPPKAIAAIKPKVMANLNKDVLKSFTPEQIEKMGSKQFNALGKKIKYLNPEGIAKIPSRTFKSIKAAAINSMTEKQIKKLTKKQIQSMKISTIRKLDPKIIKYLTDAQMSLFTPDQMKNFTVKQLKVLSSEAVAGLSIKQLDAMTPKQLFAIYVNQSPNQLVALRARIEKLHKEAALYERFISQYGGDYKHPDLPRDFTRAALKKSKKAYKEYNKESKKLDIITSKASKYKLPVNTSDNVRSVLNTVVSGVARAAEKISDTVNYAGKPPEAQVAQQNKRARESVERRDRSEQQKDACTVARLEKEFDLTREEAQNAARILKSPQAFALNEQQAAAAARRSSDSAHYNDPEKAVVNSEEHKNLVGNLEQSRNPTLRDNPKQYADFIKNSPVKNLSIVKVEKMDEWSKQQGKAPIKNQQEFDDRLKEYNEREQKQTTTERLQEQNIQKPEPVPQNEEVHHAAKRLRRI